MKKNLQSLAPIKLGLRPDQAAEIIGSEQIFREMIGAHWIAPVVSRHKLTLYDRAQVSGAWARLLAGDKLPVLPKREKGCA